MTDEEKMLAAFTFDPFVLMRALADKAAEDGREQEAAGWRWLADNERFPQCRMFYKWGWTYSNTAEARHSMPTPYSIRQGQVGYYLSTCNGVPDLGLCLKTTAEIVGKLISQNQFPRIYLKTEDSIHWLGRLKEDKKRGRRKYADMSDNEVAARRELRRQQTILRQMDDAMDTWASTPFPPGRRTPGPHTRQQRAAQYDLVDAARVALRRITHPNEPITGFTAEERRSWDSPIGEVD